MKLEMVDGRCPASEQRNERDFGTEIYELEEKVQTWIIQEQANITNLGEQLLNEINQHLTEEINECSKHSINYADGWGNHLVDELQRYLTVDDFHSISRT